MNTRHIVSLFDDAGFQLITLLGYPFPDSIDEGIGWADVHAELRFLREIRAGAALVVYTKIGKIGSKSFTCRHDLYMVGGGVCHATMQVAIVRFDLKTRSAIPLPPEFRERAGPYRSLDR